MTLPRRCPPVTLVLAAATVLNGCATYGWNTAPMKPDVDERRLRGRLVRLETEKGVVVMEVERIVHPYVIGRVQAGTGPVRLDLREARDMKLYPAATDRTAPIRPLPISMALDSESLEGREVQLRMKDGTLRLAVERLRWPWVDGSVQEGNAAVTMDMRQVTRIEVREPDVPQTAVKSAALAAGLLFLGCLIAWPQLRVGY
jgi:hypothetical protein